MIRYLTILGLALVAMVAGAALTTDDAGAVEEETTSAYYSAEGLEVEETAQIHGEQIGETTTAFTIGSLPPLTCSSIEYDGEAQTSGSVFEEPVTINPVYSTCHVIAPLLGTRTATVTMNGCAYDVAPTTTVTESEVAHFIGDLSIVCPEGKTMEVHVYNTSNANDAGASTLCTFSVPTQSNLSGITLTNSATDVVADFNIGSIQVNRTGGSEAFCGAESQTATYKGEATLRATNAAEEMVTTQVRRAKLFALGQPNATVIGDENGNAEFTTNEKAIACTTVKYEASPKDEHVGTLTFTPSYSNCKVGTFTAHVNFKSCKYQHTLIGEQDKGPSTTASVKIVCENKEKITIEVTNANKEVKCTITYAEQEMSGHVGLVNHPKSSSGANNYITFSNTLGGLSYEIAGEEAICGKTGSFELGTLHGKLDVRAYDDKMKSKAKGIRVLGNWTHVTTK